MIQKQTYSGLRRFDMEIKDLYPHVWLLGQTDSTTRAIADYGQGVLYSLFTGGYVRLI